MIWPQKKPAITFNRRRKPDELPQVNPTPYQKGLTDEGIVGDTELRDIIRKDDDQNIKPGAPYVGFMGTVHAVAKCPYCDDSIYEKPVTNEFGTKMLTFCPHCRRQMFRTIDQTGKPDFGSDPQLETGGVEMAHNLPLESELQYGISEYYDNPSGLTKAF